MNGHSEFDHRADPELGRALRGLLSAPDDAAFAARVMARLPGALPWWEVLGSWARPGLAAALVLAALGGMWLGRSLSAADTLAIDELLRLPAATEILDSAEPPRVDVVLAAVTEYD
jgi:hypothetical protein